MKYRKRSFLQHIFSFFGFDNNNQPEHGNIRKSQARIDYETAVKEKQEDLNKFFEHQEKTGKPTTLTTPRPSIRNRLAKLLPLSKKRKKSTKPPSRFIIFLAKIVNIVVVSIPAAKAAAAETAAETAAAKAEAEAIDVSIPFEDLLLEVAKIKKEEATEAKAAEKTAKSSYKKLYFPLKQYYGHKGRKVTIPGAVREIEAIKDPHQALELLEKFVTWAQIKKPHAPLHKITALKNNLLQQIKEEKVIPWEKISIWKKDAQGQAQEQTVKKAAAILPTPPIPIA
jgi:hypothetical protein